MRRRIRELRQALGDDARAARFIETAHRRGYRFIAAPPAPLEGTAPPTVSRLRLGRDTELADLARRFAQAVAGVIERGRREGVSASGARQDVVRGPRRAPHRERERGGGRKVR